MEAVGPSRARRGAAWAGARLLDVLSETERGLGDAERMRYFPVVGLGNPILDRPV
ncbi:hypothetical protein GCM10010378_45040 [Streptomyces viridochromogenes]